jgi:hypothetical protein
MNDFGTTLIGIFGAAILISVLVGLGIIGWRIIRATLIVIQNPRGHFTTLLYYGAGLFLLLGVMAIFIPAMFGALAIGVQDSIPHARDISQMVTGLFLDTIEDVQTGSFGSFDTGSAVVPDTPPSPPPQQNQGLPGPELQPGDPDMGGGHGVPPEGWVVPVQPAPEIVATQALPPPTLAPLPTSTPPPPTLVPTFDADTYNQLTPAPTPEIIR